LAVSGELEILYQKLDIIISMKQIHNTYVFLGLALAFGCFMASSAVVRAEMELVAETATPAVMVEVTEETLVVEESEATTDVVGGSSNESEVTADTSDIESATSTAQASEDAVAQSDEEIAEESTCLEGRSGAAELRAMGDIDGNGIINKIDLDILSAHYNSSSAAEAFDARADINGDGAVNFDDLLKLAQNYGKRLCELPTGAACEATLSADLNKDGGVDMDDLDILSSQYHQTASGLSADIDNDGTVDFDDLLTLAQQYNKVVCDVNGNGTPDDGDDDDDNNSSSSRRRSSSGRGGDNDGEVLGASTAACGLYLTGFVFPNRTNNLEDVVRLQLFLRNMEGSTIGTTGSYDAATQTAVRAFQSKYSVDVIKPWFDAGLLPSPTEPTGNVYLTTQRKINMLSCPSLVIPMPELK
jgi:hypothetical protein